MPSASTSTFIRPSVSMSSLSHSMKVRFSMARVADRHRLVEPLAREHEAADMLGEVARKADQFVWQARSPARIAGIVGIEAGLADVAVGQVRRHEPQTVLASAAVTSGVSPSALPTSRMARRER